MSGKHLEGHPYQCNMESVTLTYKKLEFMNTLFELRNLLQERNRIQKTCPAMLKRLHLKISETKIDLKHMLWQEKWLLRNPVNLSVLECLLKDFPELYDEFKDEVCLI